MKFARGRDRDILDVNERTQASGHYHFHVGADGFVDYELNSKGNWKDWTADCTGEFNTVMERIIQYRFTDGGKAVPCCEPEYAGMVTFHYSKEYLQ